jgi:DNA-binding NarL/FixJ family response regulator
VTDPTPTWAELRASARTVCTTEQLEVLDLAARGMSERNIARHLHISRSAVRSRLENAKSRIMKAKEAA